MGVYRTSKGRSTLKADDRAISLFDEELPVSRVKGNLAQRQLCGRWDNARSGAILK